jgi:hypothetical protein
MINSKKQQNDLYEKRRIQGNINFFTGQISHNLSECILRFNNREYYRVPNGQDWKYRAVHTDPWTGTKKYSPWKYLEIKSSTTAPMSKLQKKTQLDHKYNYIKKVIHPYLGVIK